MHMTLNGSRVQIPDDHADEPLLFVLRDHFELNGPRFGCGVGSCGACTVILDGAAVRSCVAPAASAEGAAVVTLEGLAGDGGLHPVQAAWIAESVPQCGYCQNGQVMTAAALLEATPEADDAQVAAAMDAVLCRCGTHARIKKAVRRAQATMRGAG